ncbi:sugar phosphate isomerase/epimerase family protein [Marinomonas ostreistagni]|uniref:Sugar phosphate isomerase/epimerase n=1 Tax=Marinomonas ostreistagni TaxID=359209 RepID=A0ABS0Z7J3_9GAMM|nr:sugar phosphate isomerase/epimerase [Marinomonas ostreistagni]MBJ7549604.1 sugar phosphate isomerase/epimerase [Marinomonas ostreistagni]
MSISISANLFNGNLEHIFTLFTEYGITHVDLTHTDVKADARSLENLVDLSSRYQITFNSASGLREYGGNTNHIHEYDTEMARTYIRAAKRLNCQILVVTAPTIRSKDIDHQKIINDLRILANMALPYNIQVALKVLPWSPYIGSYEIAQEIITAVDSPNFGLVLDTFLFICNAENIEILDQLPIDKIFNVQCSDLAVTLIDSLEELIDADRSKRLIPGDGYFHADIKQICKTLTTKGYRSHFSIYANGSMYQAISHEKLLDKLCSISL